MKEKIAPNIKTNKINTKTRKPSQQNKIKNQININHLN